MGRSLNLALFVIVLSGTNPCYSQWSQVLGDSTYPSATDQNPIVLSIVTFDTYVFVGTRTGDAFLGISRSSDNGTSWMTVNSGIPPNTLVNSLAVSDKNFFGGRNVFAGTQSGVFFSSDNGGSWTAVNSGLTNTSVNAVAISGTNLFAGTYGGGVFLSTDNGTNWTQTGLANTYIRSLAVNGTNIFAGVLGEIYRSTDNGTSWNMISIPNTNIGLAINEANILACTSFGIYYSSDNGATWKTVNNGLPIVSGYIRSSSVVFSGRNLFTTTDGGVYLSSDSGATWVEASTGLTNNTAFVLAVNGTNIYAGTYGGLFRRPLSDMVTSINQGSNTEGSFKLEHNYPNPFNPSTRISFAITKEGPVSLRVYDILGREVATLVNENRKAGEYTESFNGSQMASGVYVYVLRSSEGKLVGRMMMLK